MAAPRETGRSAGPKALALLEEMTSTGRSFWDVVRGPFLARELTRDDLRDLVALGLSRAGSYKRTVQLFNLPPQDYKRFLDFLHNHDLHAKPRQSSQVPGA